MAGDRLFIDTWGWLVLANSRDPAFPAVSRLRADAVSGAEVWITTDYVLDETITRLFSTAPFSKASLFVNGIFEASRQSRLDIEQVTPERFAMAWRLRVRYHDKPRISFTDLTSFVVMRELGVKEALTADSHFEQTGLGFVRRP
jgi:predicted nucleic acid-binding protein